MNEGALSMPQEMLNETDHPELVEERSVDIQELRVRSSNYSISHGKRFSPVARQLLPYGDDDGAKIRA